MPWAEGFVALVALTAVALYLLIVIRVANARRSFNIAAPAVAGHPQFERVFRVQQNTLESLVPFLVGLYFFSTHINTLAAAIIGALWVIARVIYWRGYIADPPKRRTGGLVGFICLIGLLAGAIVGVVVSILRGLPM